MSLLWHIWMSRAPSMNWKGLHTLLSAFSLNYIYIWIIQLATPLKHNTIRIIKKDNIAVSFLNLLGSLNTFKFEDPLTAQLITPALKYIWILKDSSHVNTLIKQTQLELSLWQKGFSLTFCMSSDPFMQSEGFMVLIIKDSYKTHSLVQYINIITGLQESP